MRRRALISMVGICVFAMMLTSAASAQGSDVVINEVVADNKANVDNFGATPDWIELRNEGNANVDLAGWTLSDVDNDWVMPSVHPAPGQRVLIWASDRDLAGPPLHTNFRLSSNGESVRLARPDGSLADEITYPQLAEDEAWGRDENGGLGYLLVPTPASPNSGLAPGIVTLDPPPQVFNGSLSVSLSANVGGGQTLRYTTDGSAVSSASPAYNGPLNLANSVVLRAAVESGGTVGPERTGGYTAISNSLVGRTSDLPMVLVQTNGPIGSSGQDAIVTVIDRGENGRTNLLDTPDYTGFAGLRIRGASSVSFPKKQYKFELWDNPGGESRDGTLLGIGTDDDWGLYAPGRYDRAMVQNPFIYELGDRIGVPAPGYQFVELWIEDALDASVGEGDYQGLYLLRETIEIDDDRVDLTKHTPNSAGPDGGYIVRQDRPDDCCVQIDSFSDVSGGEVAVRDPGADDITNNQLSYIDGWWDDMQAAAASRDINQINQYFDLDAFIDYWLIVMLSNDPDGWRLSTYMYKDAGGRLGWWTPVGLRPNDGERRHPQRQPRRGH